MSGFFTPFPNPEQPTPTGSDAYGVPTPSWRQIGQAVASGVRDAGGLIQGPKDLLNWAIKFTTTVIGAVLSMLLCIIAFVLGVINRSEDSAGAGLNAIASKSLENVLGPWTGQAAQGSLPARGTAGQMGDALGKQILGTIKDAVGQQSGQPISPTDLPATQLLGKMGRFAITGWLEGALLEVLPLVGSRTIMDLIPIMSENLGLGRISRRALAAPVKILVEDPYTALLNLGYRPAHLPESLAVREFFRGKFNADQLDNALGKLGHRSANIDAIVNAERKLLTADDLDWRIAHGQTTMDKAVKHLGDAGWEFQDANEVLNLALDKRLWVHHQRLIDANIAAYMRGEIDADTLHTALEASSMPESELEVLHTTVLAERVLNVKHLSLQEVERLIQAHIMSLDDLQKWMTRENYPLEEQLLLETYLLGRIGTADEAAASKKAAADARKQAAAARQAKQAAAAQAAALRAQVKGVSLATMESLVEAGQRTFADLRAFLTDLGMVPAAIQDVVDHLHLVMDQKAAAAREHAALTAEADAKHIPLAQIEKGVISGTLTMTDLQTFLTANEYTEADQTLITSYVQSQINARQAKAGAKSGAAAAAGARGISLPQLERAARLGIVTVADYSAALDKAGFDPHSRDVLVGILQEQITADTATLARRKEAAARASVGKINLPQLEQAIIDGLRPMTDYTSALGMLGYDAADTATLAELLQTRVEHAAAVAATRKAAADRLADRDISLAGLERAVKLGVASIDQYTQALADAGFDATDQATMRAALLAQVAAAKQTNTRRNSVSRSLAGKGVSLAQEEQMVKDGLLSLDSYTQFLLAHGYSQTDASNLSALLAMKLDQSQAAAKLHAAAVAKAADREISLAAEESAVVNGSRTMDDYAALLADLGYDAVDSATLEADLAAKVAANRAKAARKPKTPAPAPVPTAP